MTIEREGRHYVASCDACSEVLDDPDELSFVELTQRLKHEGWRFERIDDVWLHFCPVHNAIEIDRAVARARR